MFNHMPIFTDICMPGVHAYRAATEELCIRRKMMKKGSLGQASSEAHDQGLTGASQNRGANGECRMNAGSLMQSDPMQRFLKQNVKGRILKAKPEISLCREGSNA